MASSKSSKQWKEFLEKFKGDSNAYSTATGNLLNNISLDASGIDPRFTKSYLEEQDMLNRAKISANNIADQQTRFAGYLSYLGKNANERLAEAFTPEEKPPKDRPKYKTHIPEPYDPEGKLLKGLSDRVKELEGKSAPPTGQGGGPAFDVPRPGSNILDSVSLPAGSEHALPWDVGGYPIIGQAVGTSDMNSQAEWITGTDGIIRWSNTGEPVSKEHLNYIPRSNSNWRPPQDYWK